MKEKVVYIAELDNDIDDVIAAEYLFKKGALGYVVQDPVVTTREGFSRLFKLKNKGIEVRHDIPDGTKVIFVGGQLRKVSEYLENHDLDLLVMNGGFVGDNVKKNFTIPKFRGKTAVRTFNFNCDVLATERVLSSNRVKEIILVGKNVCHNRKNTIKGIWKDEKDIFEGYDVSDTKLQHDMLACHEGLVKMGILDEKPFVRFERLCPFNTGVDYTQDLRYVKWGSEYPKENSQFNTCTVAVDWLI